MQFIIDYLTSILVGSVVLVILLVTQASAHQKDTDQQLYAAARRHTLAFKLILEKDIPNIGYGVQNSAEPIVEWTPTSFTFLRKMNTDAASPVGAASPIVAVRYQLSQHHVIDNPDGPDIPVFEVLRTENGVAAGGTTPTITDYSHELIRRDGSTTDSPGEAVGIRVSFATVFGDRARDVVGNRSRQTLTYYPSNL